MARKMTKNDARKRLLEALNKAKKCYFANHISMKALREIELGVRKGLNEINKQSHARYK